MIVDNIKSQIIIVPAIDIPPKDCNINISFSQGQMYAALNRVTKLEKLYFLVQYRSSAIKVN